MEGKRFSCSEHSQRERQKTGNSKLKKYALPAAVLIIFLVSFVFDSKIALLMSKIRNPALDYALAAFSLSGIAMAAVLVIPPTIYLFYNDKKSILKYWFALALTLFVMIALKMIIHRQRPFEAMDLAVPAFLLSASYNVWDFSFPSNHAALSFCSLNFIKGKFFWIWLAFSLLIAFSRIYFGFHYLSDVIAGVMISYAISVFVLKWEKL